MIPARKCKSRPAQQEERWARRNFMEFEYKQMLIAKDAREEGRTKEREKILDSMAAMVKSGRMRAEDVAEVLEVPVETVLAAAAKAEEGVQ